MEGSPNAKDRHFAGARKRGALMEVVQSIVDSPRCIYGFGGAFMEVVQLWRCYQYRLVHRHLVQCAFMEVVHLWM